MRYLLRLILMISGTVCLLFPVARLLGSQRTEGQIVYAKVDINSYDRDIHLLDVRTSMVFPVTQTNRISEYSPAWRPNGQGITYIEYEHDFLPLYRLKLFDFNTRTLTTIFAVGTRICCVAWSPNGSQFLYVRGHEIIVRNLADGLERVIALGSYARWASDNIVIYAFSAADSEQWQLNAVSIDDLNHIEDTTLLEFHATHAAFSPNGQQLAFLSAQTGLLEVYVMDNDCDLPQMCLSNLEQLTNDIFMEDSLSWSPDGQWLAYNTFNVLNA